MADNKVLKPVMTERLTAKGIEIDPTLERGQLLVMEMSTKDPEREIGEFKISQKGFDRYYGNKPNFIIKKKAK